MFLKVWIYFFSKLTRRSKINELDFTSLWINQQNIFRFQITMNDWTIFKYFLAQKPVRGYDQHRTTYWKVLVSIVRSVSDIIVGRTFLSDWGKLLWNWYCAKDHINCCSKAQRPDTDVICKWNDASVWQYDIAEYHYYRRFQ